MPKTKWMEVLIIVVEGAGEQRPVKIRGTSVQAMSDEMVWSDHQDLIVKQLRIAQEIWGVKIIHGKAISNLWKDFILVNKDSNLRFINDSGDTVLDVIVKELERVWNIAKEEGQMLTDNPAVLIYTDKYDLLYDSTQRDNKLRAVGGRKGVTWLKKDKRNLPRDVAFIFAEACPDTTAHELGHLVADLPHQEGPLNIMTPVTKCVKRKATDHQKRKFASSSYIYTSPEPKQNWRPGLTSRVKVF